LTVPAGHEESASGLGCVKTFSEAPSPAKPISITPKRAELNFCLLRAWN
jgi:hypothetical protein